LSSVASAKAAYDQAVRDHGKNSTQAQEAYEAWIDARADAGE